MPLEYEVICSDDTVDFEATIEEKAVEGFELHGGFTVHYDSCGGGGYIYFQAMIRKTP